MSSVRIANSYLSGALEVAAEYIQTGVRTVTVATVSEGARDKKRPVNELKMASLVAFGLLLALAARSADAQIYTGTRPRPPYRSHRPPRPESSRARCL